MIRVVIDTNVFVSSFFGGNPRQIVDLWKEGRITWCLSRPIVDEYLGVLARLGLQEDEDLRELLTVFAQSANTLFITSPPDLNIVSEDPDDDKFIACAVALQGDVIVSGDRHLTSIENYMGIPIVDPRTFLTLFEAGRLQRG